MRKYLGSSMTAYAAIVAPLFVCGPLLFAAYLLSIGISAAVVFLAVMCLACTVIWGIYIKSVGNQLYSWGSFTQDHVKIITWFSKSTVMEYEKCKVCGIGYYTHGILNSAVGNRIYFIYLSYDAFDDRFRSRINLWKPSKTQIKVQFNEKLYDYLLAVLPRKQSQMLMRDYKKYFQDRDGSATP